MVNDWRSSLEDLETVSLTLHCILTKVQIAHSVHLQEQQFRCTLGTIVLLGAETQSLRPFNRLQSQPVQRDSRRALSRLQKTQGYEAIWTIATCLFDFEQYEEAV